MSPRPSTTENGTHCGRHQGDIMTSSSTTPSCKIAATNLPSLISILKQSPVTLVMSNILVGIMITASKSPAMAVNTWSVAAIANLINTATLQPSTYIPNGNDRFRSSRRFKIACGSGNLPSYQRLSTFLVFKSLVSCYSGILGNYR